jgi:hypothetical protein
MGRAFGRDEPRSRRRPVSRPARSPRSVQTSLLGLQSAAGNRAVAQLVARQPKTKPRPDAADKGREVRSDLKTQINAELGLIQKLQADRIDVWEANARIRKSKAGLDVLMIAIAIVSEGIGGIAYGLIEKWFTGPAAHSVKAEFTMLAGLEAGDLAAEGLFTSAVEGARSHIEAGREARTKQQIAETRKAALATKGDASPLIRKRCGCRRFRKRRHSTRPSTFQRRPNSPESSQPATCPMPSFGKCWRR